MNMIFLFPGFKSKTLTFSYDDNTTQDRKLTELFRKYGLAATFNINTGSFGQKGHLDSHEGFYCEYNRIEESEVKKLYEGFEIASHTVDHVILSDADTETFDYQVTEDCKRIGEICGIRAVGLAYPSGMYTGEAALHLQSLGIHYARTISNTFNFDLPDFFLMWHPTCHDHSKQTNFLADEFIKANDKKLKVLYIWGHSFEFDKNDTDRWADMEALCKKLSGHNDIWYATNREICDYVTAVRSIKPTDSINDTGMDIYLEENGKKVVWKNGEERRR